MANYPLLGLGLAGLMAASGMTYLTSSRELVAAQLADGTIAFEYPPRLSQATATRNQAGARHVRYYFTLSLHPTAGEPLRWVSFQLAEGHDPMFRFDPEAIQAFEGTRRERKSRLTLAEVSQDRDTQTVTVVFDPPVPPGRQVTIALEPHRNPRRGGVYLFGVTAAPAGELVRQEFAGYGRLHFYDHDSDPIR